MKLMQEKNMGTPLIEKKNFLENLQQEGYAYLVRSRKK